jgi:hypothetical protein
MGVPTGKIVPANTFTVMVEVKLPKAAVSVVVPCASAVSCGGSLDVILTRLGSPTVQVAPPTGCPMSPISVTLRLSPTSMLADAGVIRISFGGTETGSTKITATWELAVLPAKSAASTCTELDPGTTGTVQLNELELIVAGMPLQITEETPERLSETEPLTITVAALTVDPSTGEAMVRSGGVLSMFKVIVVLATFPALSEVDPDTTWFIPSSLTVSAAGQEAIPERLSIQVKVTRAEELFQPLALGDGEALAAITGGERSIFTIVMAAAELPAKSTAVALIA